MQHCVTLPLRALVCLLMAAQCSAFSAVKHEGLTEATESISVISNVQYAKGLVHCPKGILADDAGTCANTSLLLDIYKKDGTSTERKPAVLLVHGGSNQEGSKDSQAFSANFFANHGYMVFAPDYRLQSDRGTFPGEDFWVKKSAWRSLYPAVRDVKAAFRYIVANKDTYNVDTSRIIAVGSSAGAMDVLAALAVNNNSQFTSEFSWAQDPTLSTVHQHVTATAQAIIMRSGAVWGVTSYAQYSGEPAPWEDGGKLNVVGGVRPLLQFHGTADDVITIDNAHSTASYWNNLGAPNCLLVLDGAGHLRAEHRHQSLDQGIRFSTSLDQLALDFLQSLEARNDGTVECPVTPTIL